MGGNKECNATGVIPTAAVLEMVRKCAITSGGEFLLDDEPGTTGWPLAKPLTPLKVVDMCFLRGV